MNTKPYDVIIVGAGPAGSALARLLGEKRSVLLLESRTMGRQGFTREKCCGGLLAPDAARQLRAMGLALPDHVRETGQPLAVRAIDLHSCFARRYRRPYVNLNRSAFEQWLLSLVPESVTVMDGVRCARIRKTGTGWEITAAEAGTGNARTFTGDVVVGAEGASSIVRRTLDPNARERTLYLAVQDVYARYGGKEASRAEYAAFFHPLITDFYGWVIPKKDRVLLGAALPPRVGGASVSRRMDFLRSALEGAGYAFDGRVRREACLVARPDLCELFLGRDGAFCIGEAAGWISPSSAEGFSYAFASARALAGALLLGRAADDTLTAYRRNTFFLRANILWKNAKRPFMYVPPLRRLIMRAGILAAPRD